MTGVVMRFFPPGHSSRVNSMGQFSIPIFTPADLAWSRIGLHVSTIRGQLSSTLSFQSRPMNVFITADAHRLAASITRWICSTAIWASSGTGDNALG